LVSENNKNFIKVIVFIISGIVISSVSISITTLIFNTIFKINRDLEYFAYALLILFDFGLAFYIPAIIGRFINKKGSEPKTEKNKTFFESKSNQKIFISYRRNDNPLVAGRIYDNLIDQFGDKNIYKDIDSIPLGVDFKVHIDDAIKKCKVLLVVIGDKWLSITDREGKPAILNPKDYVRIEISAAINRNIPVIPILIENAKIPDDKDLPDDVRNLTCRNGIQIRPDPDFHNDMSRLIKGLKEFI